MGTNNTKSRSNSTSIRSISSNLFASEAANSLQDIDKKNNIFSEKNYNQSGDSLIYFFGEDADGMKIVSFDPIKYELKKKKLPTNFEIRNYPGCIQLDSKRICICGGINKDLNKITNKFYIYNPSIDSVVEKSSMNQIRYTFP